MRRVEQAVLVELALDLDQAIADSGQEIHAGRLVVDKGAAAAIGAEGAAQHECAVAVQAGLGDQRARRVIVGDIEHRRDAGLFRLAPDQTRLGPLTQGQAEGIQQDRFAGAGFTGQHREAGLKIKAEVVDKHHVANGQAGQHAFDPPLRRDP